MEKDNSNNIVAQDKLMSDKKINDAGKVKKRYIGVIIIQTAIVLCLLGGCIYLGMKHKHHVSRGYSIYLHEKNGGDTREDIEVDKDKGVEIHHVANQAELVHHNLGIGVMKHVREKVCYLRDLDKEEEYSKINDEQDIEDEEIPSLESEDVIEKFYIEDYKRPVARNELGETILDFCRDMNITWVEETTKDKVEDREKADLIQKRDIYSYSYYTYGYCSCKGRSCSIYRKTRTTATLRYCCIRGRYSCSRYCTKVARVTYRTVYVSRKTVK